MDTFSKEERSQIMRAVKSKGTKPEMKVRRAIHAAGFRYRLHSRKLPGSPDLVFPRYRVAVFVHGCFWHWHGCKRSRMPSANQEYWRRKISRNIERDRRVQTLLRETGWQVVTIWECSLSEGIANLLELLRELRERDL